MSTVINGNRRSRKVVTSYGLICHRLRVDFETREVYPEFLLIQRRDTISYVEFLRGKYSHGNMSYVRKLLATMTQAEKERVANVPFADLWKMFWGSFKNDPHCACEGAFHGASTAHMRLVGSLGPGGLRQLVDSVEECADEQEWSFPKGRKMQCESDVVCAMREFEEETGYSRANVHVFDIPSYEEVFDGGNGIVYRHVYFLCRLVDMRNRPAAHPPTGSVRARETRDMRWFDLTSVCDKFKRAPTRVNVAMRANADAVAILAPGVCAPTPTTQASAG